MKLVTKFKILISFILLISSFESNAIEKIIDPIKNRQLIMVKIQKLSQKIYKDIVIKKNIEQLSVSANSILSNTNFFIQLFPENSRGGEASSDIWNQSEVFTEYQNNFIKDINYFIQSIESKNLEKIFSNFNKMSENCGKCHRKFKD